MTKVWAHLYQAQDFICEVLGSLEIALPEVVHRPEYAARLGQKPRLDLQKNEEVCSPFSSQFSRGTPVPQLEATANQGVGKPPPSRHMHFIWNLHFTVRVSIFLSVYY